MKSSFATIIKASAVVAFVLVATRGLVLASVEVPQQELGAQFISNHLDLVLPSAENSKPQLQQCSTNNTKQKLTSI